MLGFVIRALNSLADQTMHLGDGRIVHRSNEKEIESTWQNVWFETMKAIYSRNINEYGYNLLASILKVSSLVVEIAFESSASSDIKVLGWILVLANSAYQ